jgi:hypothetical protein
MQAMNGPVSLAPGMDKEQLPFYHHDDGIFYNGLYFIFYPSHYVNTFILLPF